MFLLLTIIFIAIVPAAIPRSSIRSTWQAFVVLWWGSPGQREGKLIQADSVGAVDVFQETIHHASSSGLGLELGSDLRADSVTRDAGEASGSFGVVNFSGEVDVTGEVSRDMLSQARGHGHVSLEMQQSESLDLAAADRIKKAKRWARVVVVTVAEKTSNAAIKEMIRVNDKYCRTHKYSRSVLGKYGQSLKGRGSSVTVKHDGKAGVVLALLLQDKWDFVVWIAEDAGVRKQEITVESVFDEADPKVRVGAAKFGPSPKIVSAVVVLPVSTLSFLMSWILIPYTFSLY